MLPVIQRLDTPLSPAEAIARLSSAEHPVLLASGGNHGTHSRYSVLAAYPFQTFVAHGASGEWRNEVGHVVARPFGNPWQILREKILQYETLDQPDTPFPLGGCFGYWGYDLKQFVEPRVRRASINDLQFADCRVGFYPSLIVWDHHSSEVRIVATGLDETGSRTAKRAAEQVAHWKSVLNRPALPESPAPRIAGHPPDRTRVTLDADPFLNAVARAKDYIRRGDIYQVNLSRRWTVDRTVDPTALFQAIQTIAPAPFGGFMSWGDNALLSASPEQFLRMSGRQVITRPIKGTRPRSSDPDEDARYSYELQSSEKERAELVMITDLLRNDIGRVCEFGTVQVPDLLKLERFSHVQHLVSTVEGRLRTDVAHVDALAACFPGGSITGAPKVRAMQIIEELEPVSRGPYTGSMGYIGFNRESQLNILIRTAFVEADRIHYHAGSGIVADSDPLAELEETNVKARAFFQALKHIVSGNSTTKHQQSDEASSH